MTVKTYWVIEGDRTNKTVRSSFEEAEEIAKREANNTGKPVYMTSHFSENGKTWQHTQTYRPKRQEKQQSGGFGFGGGGFGSQSRGSGLGSFKVKPIKLGF